MLVMSSQLFPVPSVLFIQARAQILFFMSRPKVCRLANYQVSRHVIQAYESRRKSVPVFMSRAEDNSASRPDQNNVLLPPLFMFDEEKISEDGGRTDTGICAHERHRQQAAAHS